MSLCTANLLRIQRRNSKQKTYRNICWTWFSDSVINNKRSTAAYHRLVWSELEFHRVLHTMRCTDPSSTTQIQRSSSDTESCTSVHWAALSRPFWNTLRQTSVRQENSDSRLFCIGGQCSWLYSSVRLGRETRRRRLESIGSNQLIIRIQNTHNQLDWYCSIGSGIASSIIIINNYKI